MAHAPFTRTRITWQSYLMIAYYAYLLNALGPVTPFLRDELGLSYTQVSLHFSAYALGVILTGLLTHAAARRFGVHAVVWTGALGMSLGAVLLMAGRSAPVTIAGAFLMGFLGVFMVSLINSALAEVQGQHRALAFTESSVISSLVAGFSPLAVGVFARTALSWRAALGMAFVMLIPLWLIYGRDALPAMDTGEAEGQDGGKTAGSRRTAGSENAPKRPLPFVYWLYWVAILLSVAIEFCFVFWSADYLSGVIGLSRPDAALGVSAFLGAMLAGRALLSGLLRRMPVHQLMWLALGLALMGFFIFWSAPLTGTVKIVVALGGLIVAGLGVSGLFPLVNAFALDSVPGRMVEANSRISLAIGTAILLLPLLLGRLADGLNLHLAFGLEGVLILLAAGLITWARSAAAGELANLKQAGEC